MNTPARLRASWYLIALVPLTIGILVAIKLVFAMLDDVERMDRVVVPGERTLQLAAGEYVLYIETRSQVDGVTYHASGGRLTCAMADRDGVPVELDTPNGSTTYSFGGFAGNSFAEASIATAGAYTLTCTGGAAVVAIGDGIGTQIVGVLVASLLALGLAITAVVLVRRRRRKAPVVVWPHL